MTRISGQKRLNSLIQLERTESGQSTRCGPCTSRSNLRCARKAIVCSVLPAGASRRRVERESAKKRADETANGAKREVSTRR